MNAPCPSSHPVKLPQLFYEIVWDTRQFNNQNDWPTDGSQPFVFSFGDTTGYGQHGDYMFGWEGDSLQRAMDQQCNVFCGTLKSQDVNTANRCTIPRRVNEQIDQGELSSNTLVFVCLAKITKEISRLDQATRKQPYHSLNVRRVRIRVPWLSSTFDWDFVMSHRFWTPWLGTIWE